MYLANSSLYIPCIPCFVNEPSGTDRTATLGEICTHELAVDQTISNVSKSTIITNSGRLIFPEWLLYWKILNASLKLFKVKLTVRLSVRKYILPQGVFSTSVNIILLTNMYVHVRTHKIHGHVKFSNNELKHWNACKHM